MDDWTRYFLAGACALLVAYAAMAFALGTPSFLATVTSDSMRPSLERGDWVVLKNQPSYSVHDVVVFSLNPGNAYVHRVVALAQYPASSGGVGYRTKGDANSNPDGWTVPAEAVVGKVVMRIPRLGYLSLWLDGR